MKPFICPVCRGKGKVPNGFYTTIGGEGWTSISMEPESCRTCLGTGIVWGPPTIIYQKEPNLNQIVEDMQINKQHPFETSQNIDWGLD